MDGLKEVVILGAGYAGVTAAHALAKKLRKDPTVRVRLIDDNLTHVLLTQLHEVAGNRIKPCDVEIHMKDVFKHSKVELVEDHIENIDFEKQVLTGKDGKQYSYDYLVLGSGSEPTYFGIPGMEEHSFTLWSLEDAKKIKAHIRSMFIAAAKEDDPKKREAMLTFVVGGGGFTGIEMMGELAEWVRDLCQVYSVDRGDVRLIVVEALDKILSVLKSGSVHRAVRYLEDVLHVELMTCCTIKEVYPDSIELDKCTIPTRTLIWTGGVQANSFVKKLGLSLNKRNRLDVNEYCQTRYENVYAVGDNAYFLEKDGQALPPLVETAMQTAKAAANNIVNSLKGRPLKPLKPALHGVMVSIGGNYAVAEIMGIPMWGFLAMMMKHMVDIHYLWEVNGFAQIWWYIAHEFTEIKGGIGVVVRHLSSRMNTFWLTLLRVVIGVRFLTEGIKKIGDGYFTNYEKLASGASNILWTDATPQWYIWIMKTFIVPYQLVIQKVIVIAEIGLGICLILGLFTVLASLGTMAMSASFVMAAWGGAIWDPLMLLVASFALLGGAGRAFGLDYYVMPWLFSLSKKPTPYPKHITFEQ